MWALSRHVRPAYRGVRKLSTLTLASRDRLLSSRVLPLPVSQSSAASTILFRKYAAAQTAHKENIDPLLQRLDEDVRRFGRLSRKDLDKLIDSIRIQKNITSSQALLVIRCCGDLVPDEFPTERTKLAEELWKTFLARKTPMDISHYNALLRVYLENGHNFSTEEFSKELEAKGLEPNRVTYQRFMLYYCQKGDVEKASHILETMRAKNLPLNAAVLDALVLGHIRQGNMEGVESVLKAMSSAGLNPTAHTYAIIMGGHARKGDIESVKKILEDSINQEIYFSDKDLMDVIEEFANGGHREHVGFMLSQMQRSPGYNQEAINLIYKLINKTHYDIAIEVLQSMIKSTFVNENSTPNFQASFFIKQLIKTNTPIDVIISLTKKLQSSNISPKAVQIATNIAIQQGNFELSIALFNTLKEIKEPVRLHYFWPLFVKCDVKMTLEILRCMVEEFDLNTNIETLKSYILPKMKNDNPSKLIEILRENGASTINTVRSVLQNLLSENRLTEASQVVSTYGSKTDLKNLSNGLAKAFVNNQDIDSLLNILSITCSEEIAVKSNQSENADEIIKEVKAEQRDVLGNMLAFLMHENANITEEKINLVLKGYLSNNLAISNQSLENIKNKCKTISGENNELLTKLSNNDLNPEGYEKVNSPPTRRTSQQLESLINIIESKGENANKLRRQLLQTYCRSKDTENAERIMKDCEEKKFVLTTGTLAVIFEMYSNVGNSIKATELLEKIRSTEPDFVIDNLKMIKYALLLIKEDMLDKGIKVLEELPRKSIEEFDENHNLSRSIYSNILNVMAEKCNPDKVKAVFEMFVDKNFIKPSSLMLGSIIKCHLRMDNLNSALEEFESCCSQYKCTPHKPELIRQLIMKEDANGLQKLTDLSTTVHGEINSLYDLVFGFTECNRLKQARRILETPGMRIGNKRLIDVSKFYIKQGMIDQLEKLVDITKGLSHIDRINMFESLLNHYISVDNSEKCLGLWTTLQEESVPPSDEFLIGLSKYLNTKNLPVPFIVPNLKSKSKEIKNIETKRNVKSESTKPIDKYFDIFKSYLDEKKFDQAKDMIVEMLNAGSISNNLLIFAVNKFSVHGKFEILNDLNTLLSENQKKLVSFDNKLCFATSAGGNIGTYMDTLEQRLSTVTEDNKKSIENMFPRGGIMGVLSNRDHFERAKDVIEKYAAKGITGPMNSLWSFYLIEGNYNESDKIFEKYLKNAEVVYFQKVLETSRLNKDVNVLTKLIRDLKTNTNVTNNTFAIIYSQQLDILRNLNNLDDACKVLDAIVQHGIPLSSLNTRKLNNLKNAIEASGKTFKYEF